MHSTIVAEINASDQQGKYLDQAAIAKLEFLFHKHQLTEDLRLKTANLIRENAATIVQETALRSLSYPDATKPTSNLKMARYYAACIRDIDCFLRYATYAMLAGDTSILEQRVLIGLKETFLSLGVSIDVTINAINLLKDVTIELIGVDAGQEIGVYLDYICTYSGVQVH